VAERKVSPRESKSAKRARAVEVYDRLHAAYPDVHCTLDFSTPFELMIGTILAAQCTDERVNIVTKDLFRKYRGPKDYLKVPLGELEKDIQSCGFYRNKAKNIAAAAHRILEEYGGEVPGTMEDLLTLPGVGRKTANVILGECFNGQGVVVDTHCTRVSRRLGFTKQLDPGKIEQELMQVWPPDRWTLFSHLMVFHGRACCTARGPRCSQCPVRELCPFPDTAEGKKIAR
jgi:endonuclease-3